MRQSASSTLVALRLSSKRPDSTRIAITPSDFPTPTPDEFLGLSQAWTWVLTVRELVHGRSGEADFVESSAVGGKVHCASTESGVRVPVSPGVAQVCDTDAVPGLSHAFHRVLLRQDVCAVETNTKVRMADLVHDFRPRCPGAQEAVGRRLQRQRHTQWLCPGEKYFELLSQHLERILERCWYQCVAPAGQDYQHADVQVVRQLHAFEILAGGELTKFRVRTDEIELDRVERGAAQAQVPDQSPQLETLELAEALDVQVRRD